MLEANPLKKNSSTWIVFIVLQLMNVLYSLDSVMIKFVSVRWAEDGLFCFSTLSFLTLSLVILIIYAVLWQRILASVDLTVAYMCKGVIIFWGMIWACVIFGEHIIYINIIGVALIFFGTYIVTVYE